MRMKMMMKIIRKQQQHARMHTAGRSKRSKPQTPPIVPPTIAPILEEEDGEEDGEVQVIISPETIPLQSSQELLSRLKNCEDAQGLQLRLSILVPLQKTHELLEVGEKMS